MFKKIFLFGFILIFVVCLIVNVSATNFNSTWNTSKVAGDKNITLPLEFGGTYDFTVNWGDGNTTTVISYDSVNATHDYGEEGVYNVSINGTIVGFRFANAGDKLKIIDISQWGDLNLGNSGWYFYGTTNLNISATDILNLTGTTTMYMAFRGSGITTVPNMGDWNMSEVTTMQTMFFLATNFNEDIGNWDVGKVESLYNTFYYAEAFNGNINNWDTSSVTNMKSMFQSASDFNQNLSNWNTSENNKFINNQGLIF